MQPDYCDNGGTCLEEDGDTASCNCPTDYTGATCQTGSNIYYTRFGSLILKCMFKLNLYNLVSFTILEIAY